MSEADTGLYRAILLAVGIMCLMVVGSLLIFADNSEALNIISDWWIGIITKLAGIGLILGTVYAVYFCLR